MLLFSVKYLRVCGAKAFHFCTRSIKITGQFTLFGNDCWDEMQITLEMDVVAGLDK